MRIGLASTVCLALWAGGGRMLAEGSAPAWQEIKLQHFIISYVQDRGFAEELGRKAEAYYDSIGRDLGFARHDAFWLWDRRAKLLVYPSRAAFAEATGAPDWAVGKANAVDRVIATYEGSRAFLDSVLPHEMTHLIFQEFVGFKQDIPLWLNEGVAQWEDRLNRDRTMEQVRTLFRKQGLIPLESLTRLDVRTVSAGRLAAVFYAQSVSLVGFMIETYGSRRFRQFCGHLRDGKPVDEALQFTYPGEVRNIEALEQAWHRHLED